MSWRGGSLIRGTRLVESVEVGVFVCVYVSIRIRVLVCECVYVHGYWTTPLVTGHFGGHTRGSTYDTRRMRGRAGDGGGDGSDDNDHDQTMSDDSNFAIIRPPI